MKHKQKIALLSVAAIPAMITMVPDTNIQAAQQAGSGSWSNLQHTFVAEPTLSVMNTEAETTPLTAATTDELATVLATQFKDYKTTFTVQYTGGATGLRVAIDEAFKTFDENIDNSRYTAATISRDYAYEGYVNNVTITFNIQYNTTKVQEELLDEKITSIYKSIFKSTNLSNFQKIKMIHDYVVQNSTYTPEVASPHSATTLLETGKGLSQAYALVTYHLLLKAGFKAHYVTGEVAGTPHAWNLVEYEGNWYHLDTAWDEPAIFDSSMTNKDAISYQYFLRGSDMTSTNAPHQLNTYSPVPTIAGVSPANIEKIQDVINPNVLNNVLYYAKISNKQLAKLDLQPQVGKDATGTLTETVFTDSGSNVTGQDLVQKDGWIYFSHLGKNGFLYKIQIGGTDLTPIVEEYARDLKISDSTLTYTNAAGKTVSITLVQDTAAIANVKTLISAINTVSPEPLKVIAAEIAYKALSSAQKLNVDNFEILTTANDKIHADANASDASDIAKINKVILVIGLLDPKSKDFNTEMTEAKRLFDDLSTIEDAQSKVSNKDVYDEMLALYNNNDTPIEEAKEAIKAIIEGSDNYYKQIENALKLYNALTAAQRTEIDKSTLDKKLMSAVEKLNKAKSAVFNFNYQLLLLNDTAENFEANFLSLEDELTNNLVGLESLIPNINNYKKAESTYNTYKTKVEKLQARMMAITSETKPIELAAIDSDYKALNLAERAMVDPAAVTKLQDALFVAFQQANSAEAVTVKITNLNPTDADYMTKVLDAKKAYDALPPTEMDKIKPEVKALLEKAVANVDNIKLMITAVDKIPSKPTTDTSFVTTYKQLVADAQTIYDKLKDQNVDMHISNLAAFSIAAKNVADAGEVAKQLQALKDGSSAKDVMAANSAYNALTEIGKLLAGDTTKLKELLAKFNKEIADEVAKLIIALDIKNATTYIEDVENANKKYTELTEEQKKQIDADTKAHLDDALKTIAPLTNVRNSIAAVSETDTANYLAKATAAIEAYNKLNAEQKKLIPDAETKITAMIANINAAKAMIAEIDALSKDSTEETILAAQVKYELLSEFQKKLVTNYSKLESLVDKANGKEQAEAVIKMIDKLDETKKTFAIDVKKAREAYDKLSDKQKEYVSNYQDLLDAEKLVADLAGTSDIAQKMIAQIAAINNISASFKADVEAAKSAYAALPEEQQALVNNYNILKEHLATYDKYAAQAKKLEDKINALSDSSPGYQAALAALQSEYNAFNAAQKAFVPEYAVKLLNAAQSGIDAVRNVTNMILALNQYKITFHADVANARAAYNALIKNHGVYLSAYLEEALEKAEALIEKDKTASRKVVNAINSLSSDSILKEIERARRVYNNLTPLQRPLVTNLQTIIDFETGKLSYNTSGIPDGVDTDDKSANTEEKNPLPDFAAVPGERTAMTKSAKSNTYTAQIYVSDEVGNSERFVLTTRSNVTAIIPPTVTVVGDKTGTMAIEIQATSSRVSFKATMGKKPVTFATEVDIILESVPKNSIILRVDQYGNRVPATYTVDGNQYTIKTKTSDTFIITRSK